ncbi:TPA: site-specific integrase, partial [Streptococcus suis]
MEYTIISNYLNYCKTHKRLSTHTLRAYKNDLMQFYNSNNECVVSYIEGLTR